MREIHDPPEQQEEPKLILVHWFAPEGLHTNLSHSGRTERFALNWWW